MPFQRVLCVLKGEESDRDAIEIAVSVLQGSQKLLYIVYVILVDRRFPLDGNMPDEVRRAEGILANAEKMSGLEQQEIKGGILQGRSLSHTIVQEIFDKRIGAVVLAARMEDAFGDLSLDRDCEHLLANLPITLILIRKSLEHYQEDASDA